MAPRAELFIIGLVGQEIKEIPLFEYHYTNQNLSNRNYIQVDPFQNQVF